jgi:hypothetical protein
MSQLKEAWKPIVNKLGQLSKQSNRSTIATEVGYRSIDGANRNRDTTGVSTIELQGPADCYQVMFESFKGRNGGGESSGRIGQPIPSRVEHRIMTLRPIIYLLRIFSSYTLELNYEILRHPHLDV